MAKRRVMGRGTLEEITIRLPAELCALLRMVARRRASRQGGEPNVSKYVLEIMERHREEIEREAQPEMRM